MTNRINALVVVLDEDIREDDVQSLVDAIKHFNHVVSVDMNIADLAAHLAYQRARSELRSKLWGVLYPTNYLS